MNIEPLLVREPPVKPVTFSTSGSSRTIFMKSSSLPRIAWNEMLWSAWIKPIRRPVSCSGKKVFGMLIYSQTLSATVARNTASTQREWPSTQFSERP